MTTKTKPVDDILQVGDRVVTPANKQAIVEAFTNDGRVRVRYVGEIVELKAELLKWVK